jgi:hypothetical protein
MELVADDPKIISGPVEISSDDPRRRIFAYHVRQGETVRDVPVTISAALMASSPSNPLFAAIVATKDDPGLRNRCQRAASRRGSRFSSWKRPSARVWTELRRKRHGSHSDQRA